MNGSRSRLILRLLQERTAARPITFADYMRMVLYEPSLGYYTGPPESAARLDYMTSPEISPLFGVLVAKRLLDVWDSTGRPETFYVVELGARTPALAAPLLAATCGIDTAIGVVERWLSATSEAMEAVTQTESAASGGQDSPRKRDFLGPLADTTVWSVILDALGMGTVSAASRPRSLVYVAADPLFACSSRPPSASRSTGTRENEVPEVEARTNRPGARWIGVDSLAAASAELEALGVKHGAVVANEVLDNQPAHLLLASSRKPHTELYVSASDNGVTFVPGPVSKPVAEGLVSGACSAEYPLASLPGGIRTRICEALGIDPTEASPDEVVLVCSPDQIRLASQAARTRGCRALLFFDMSDSAFSHSPVKTFARQEQGDDPLQSPGEADITVPVHWEIVAATLEEAGFTTRCVTQTDWVELLGIAEVRKALSNSWSSGLPSPETEERSTTARLASSPGHATTPAGRSDPFLYLKLRSLWVQAGALSDPKGLGGFTVLDAVKQ